MTMPLHDLEQAYDELAQAVDRAGAHGERLLAKLVLLLAHELGDRERLTALIAVAEADL